MNFDKFTAFVIIIKKVIVSFKTRKCESMVKVAIITGASNGMGYEATKLFAERGYQVYAGARRVEKIPTADNIYPFKWDVTSSEDNHRSIDKIISHAGRIDILINNAGYGEYGPAEEIAMAKVRKQFETNFFAAVEITQLVLPTMRAQKFGRIVNIASIGGDVYMPLGSYYHATKAALQQWSDVLDLEVKRFGIRSICIQPGGTSSNWSGIALKNAQENMSENSAYQPLVTAVSDGFGLFMKNAPSSAQLAKLFYKAATAKKPKLRYLNSYSDRLMVATAKNAQPLFHYIIDKMVNYFENKTKASD